MRTALIIVLCLSLKINLLAGIGDPGWQFERKAPVKKERPTFTDPGQEAAFDLAELNRRRASTGASIGILGYGGGLVLIPLGIGVYAAEEDQKHHGERKNGTASVGLAIIAVGGVMLITALCLLPQWKRLGREIEALEQKQHQETRLEFWRDDESSGLRLARRF